MTTMNERWGDGSDHEVCPHCLMCMTCKDCQCTQDSAWPAPQEKETGTEPATGKAV